MGYGVPGRCQKPEPDWHYARFRLRLRPRGDYAPAGRAYSSERDVHVPRKTNNSRFPKTCFGETPKPAQLLVVGVYLAHSFDISSQVVGRYPVYLRPARPPLHQTRHAGSVRADPIANQCDRRVCFGESAGPDREYVLHSRRNK
jgi:hypothetical protein